MTAVTLVDIARSSAQPSRSIQFNLLSLPDPGNDDTSSTREYMLVSSACNHRSSNPANEACDIHEIQTVLPHSGKYASYFVGSRIVSDPALHVATRVDPLFFALAYLQRARTTDPGRLEKWQPWDQALGDLPPSILRALGVNPKLSIEGVGAAGQLGHLLDVSDMCGEDLILCKFSEERTAKWLVAKFERSVEGLRRRLHENKRRAVERSDELKGMRGGSGAFSSSFTVAGEEEKPAADIPVRDEKRNSIEEQEAMNPSLSKEEEHSLRVGALQLICDYVPSEWKTQLSKEVGINEVDWMGKKKSKSSTNTDGEESNVSGEKRPRSSWEGKVGQADADALMQYTSGSSSKGAVITPGGKKDVLNTQSVGLKKLAKVNTKGMKSLASFFGASKKKKK